MLLFLFLPCQLDADVTAETGVAILHGRKESLRGRLDGQRRVEGGRELIKASLLLCALVLTGELKCIPWTKHVGAVLAT